MPVELGRKDGIWDDVQLQVQIFRYLSSNKHLNFIRLRANSTVPTTESCCCCTQRKEEKRGRGREGRRARASSSHSVSQLLLCDQLGDHRIQRRLSAASQPASQPAGAGVREERNADARQKCGAGKSEASAATDERTAERKERVSGGEGEGGGGGGPNALTSSPLPSSRSCAQPARLAR